MANQKYAKYFLKEPWGLPGRGGNSEPDAPVYIGVGQKEPVQGWDESISQVLRPIYKAYTMIAKPHVHSCAEILYFIGGNPMNFKDFGAEVEFVVGEGADAETYIINSTTWVYMPKNLPHCPLTFKRVDRPIMFGHVMFTPSFESSFVSGGFKA